MARPLLSTQELRDKIDCYLNPTEYEQIYSKSKTAGLSVSAFLRRSALDKKINQIPTGNVQHWQELSRLASNLNQIAKHLNEGYYFDADVTAQLVHELLEQVRGLRLDLTRGNDDSQAG